MSQSSKPEVVVITGASAGVGRALVLPLDVADAAAVEAAAAIPGDAKARTARDGGGCAGAGLRIINERN